VEISKFRGKEQIPQLG